MKIKNILAFGLTFFMLPQLGFAEVFQVNTEVIAIDPTIIGDLNSDLLISQKIITEESLQEATLESAMAQPKQIRENYRYMAYFVTIGEQRLGIGQMVSTRKKGSSTNIIGVKDKNIILISCVTEKQKARWNTNECAKTIQQTYSLEISNQQIKENEKEFTLPQL